MKILIIYRSKTGFTKRYAQWLREDLACDCVPYRERNLPDLSRYDGVVYGAGFYAGKILGLPWFLKQLPKLSGKRLAVFCTGATPPDAPAVEQAVSRNFTPAQRESVQTFYLWSGLNYEKMGRKDRFLMKMLQKVLASKKGASLEDWEMAAAITSSFDKTDRQNLKALEDYLRG